MDPIDSKELADRAVSIIKKMKVINEEVDIVMSERGSQIGALAQKISHLLSTEDTPIVDAVFALLTTALAGAREMQMTPLELSCAMLHIDATYKSALEVYSEKPISN